MRDRTTVVAAVFLIVGAILVLFDSTRIAGTALVAFGAGVLWGRRGDTLLPGKKGEPWRDRIKQ